MDSAKKLFGEMAARDARLIGQHDGAPAGFVDQAHGFGGEIEQAELGRVGYVTDLLIERAVAVKENRPMI